MRLLLSLKAINDFAYDLKYYNKIQGFIYGLIKDTEFGLLHNKKSYKFFSFSNLFPVNNFKSGSFCSLIIASPNEHFVKILFERLSKFIDKPVHIGEYAFKLSSVSIVKPLLNVHSSLITGTPIILRIPKKNFGLYGISSSHSFAFWRPEYGLEPFIKQLESNLFKKYNQFHNVKVNEQSLFEVFNFLKSTNNHVVINGFERQIIGSTWEFSFTHLSAEQRKILEFALDTGLGELNSLGFGFINTKKKVNNKQGGWKLNNDR